MDKTGQQAGPIDYSTQTRLITLGLIIANLSVFYFMYQAAVDQGLGVFTNSLLLDFGANYNPLVTQGEFWRLLAGMFIHGDLTHLLANMFALSYFIFFAGNIFKPSTFVFIYFISGLASSTISLYTYPEAVGCGASAAIMGLYGSVAAYCLFVKNLPKGVIFLFILAVRGIYSDISQILEPAMGLGVNFDEQAVTNHMGHIVGFSFGFMSCMLVMLEQSLKQILALSFSLMVVVGVFMAPKRENFFNVANSFIKEVNDCTSLVDRMSQKIAKQKKVIHAPSIQKVIINHSRRHCRDNAVKLALIRQKFINSPMSYQRIGKMIEILKYLEYENYGKALVISAMSYGESIKRAKSMGEFNNLHDNLKHHVINKVSQYNKGISLYKKSIPKQLQRDADSFIENSNKAIQEIYNASSRLQVAIRAQSKVQRAARSQFNRKKFKSHNQNYRRHPARIPNQ